MLDVGCGKALPLAKLLYVNKMSPKYYVGVDLNKFSIPEMLLGKKIPMSIWSETDALCLESEDVGFSQNGTVPELPNVVVCYECAEHMHPAHLRKLLKHFQELTTQDCRYFISTPCYNGSAASNHINELSYLSLGSLLEDLGYKVEAVYGTFASISDYQDKLECVPSFDKVTGKKVAETNLVPIFNALRDYYDTNVLSVIFAPLFPAQSRNCLWELTKKKGDSALQPRLFPALETCPTPWTSHKDWKELAG